MDAIFKTNDRGFLNKDEGLAAYNLIAEIYKYNNKKENKEEIDITCDLVLSDCSRQITFDFCISDKNFDKRFEDVMYKVNKLKEVLDKVEKFLLKAKEINDNASVVSM